jgi:hypothetical protein
MKKLVTLALAGICALAFASVADAGTVLRQTTVTTVTAKETLKKDSSVYANTATNTYSWKSGGWTIDYIYSSDITHSQTVLDNLRNALNDPYKSLVPAVADEATTVGLKALSVSSHGSVDGSVTATAASMNDNWKSTDYVARNIIPGRCARMDSEKDAQGVDGEYVSQEQEQAETTISDPVVTNDRQITSHIGSSSVDVVTYTVVDGEIVKNVNTIINYDTERTTIYSASRNKYVSPIVLDVTGNGVLQASNGQHMPGHPVVNKNVILADFYGDGFEVAMEWVGPQDGLLVAPKADGSVDMSCLFGTAGGYENGYEKLSLYDTNNDRLINGAELNGLSVWQDANSNGIADANEVKTVQELGITEIAVTPDNNFISSFTMNGNTNKMWDWWPNAMELVKNSWQINLKT